MSTENPLASLRTKLKRSGYKLAETEDDSLRVDLSLFCSVRIRHNDKGYRFEPRFGRLGRSTATWLLMVVSLVSMAAILILPAFLELSPAEKRIMPGVQMFLVTCLILGHLWDVLRYILTEHFITRAEAMLPDRDETA